MAATPSLVVEINVGGTVRAGWFGGAALISLSLQKGTLFSTFLSTLTKQPSSMLAAMFSGRYAERGAPSARALTIVFSHPLLRDASGRPFLGLSSRLVRVLSSAHVCWH